MSRDIEDAKKIISLAGSIVNNMNIKVSAVQNSNL